MDYLGQLINNPTIQGLTRADNQKIKQCALGVLDLKVNVFVASKNELKVQAAKTATLNWLRELLGFNNEANYSITGFEIPSEISEQPTDKSYTTIGARNRLSNLRKELEQYIINDNSLYILIALENGLIQEHVPYIKNREIFVNSNDMVWVDRCVVLGEVLFCDNCWHLDIISNGVTTPKAEVKLSEESNWSKTAGSFIATKYGWNAKDWHGAICGTGILEIMTDGIECALGLPFAIPPKPNGNVFKSDIYHQY